MASIYHYNPKAVYKPNHGVYQQQLKSKDLTSQRIVVDQQGSGFDVQFPDIFQDYKITKAADDLLLQKWITHPLLFWQTQLDFAVYCATTACGISMEHLRSKIPMVRVIYRFHVYFQIRKVLDELEIALPRQANFSKFANQYNHQKFDYLSSFFGVESQDLTWNQFYSSYQSKRRYYATPGLEYFDENSWSRWILEKSEGLTRVGIEKLSQSVRFYAYLILESQANARSTIIGNDSRAIDAQSLFVTSFEKLVVKPSSTSDEIAQFQNVLKYARSKVDFSAAIGVYMIPSDLQLHIGSVKNFNNKILVSQQGFTIGVNTSVNDENDPFKGKREPKGGSVTDPLKDGRQPIPKRAPKGGWGKAEPTAPPKPTVHPPMQAVLDHEEEKQALIIGGTSLILLMIWFLKA